MAAQAKEVQDKAKEKKLKGNLIPMLNNFLDRARMIANTERDLKKSIAAGKEHNNKENLVKMKVRHVRMERMEKKVSQQKADNSAEASADRQTADRDAAMAEDKDKQLQGA